MDTPVHLSACIHLKELEEKAFFPHFIEGFCQVNKDGHGFQFLLEGILDVLG